MIIEGKKRKNPDICNVDKKKIIEEELEKTILLCEKNAQFVLKEGL